MTRTVRAGEKGVDFSFARPPAARLLELGYSFVVGYISVPPSSAAKNITKAECEAYVDAGLAVLLVWEMSATRANLGAKYGTQDGKDAKALATARGYPLEVAILVADDTNTTTANIDKQEQYMRAFAAECAPYTIGIYGDVDILGRCTDLWKIGWLPNAWSWSGGSRAQAEAKAKALGAHVLQRKGFWIDDTWAVDPNDVIADFLAWGNPLPPPIPDPLPEDEMIDIAKDAETSLDKFAVMPDGTLRPLSGTELKARNITNSIELGVPLTKAERDALGAYVPGDGTVDQVARDSADHANEAVTRIGTTISDIRIGGQRIADAGGQ